MIKYFLRKKGEEVTGMRYEAVGRGTFLFRFSVLKKEKGIFLKS